MDPRISFVTLVVHNLEASRAFYVGGLGWPVELEAPGEVLMIRVGDKLILSFWQESAAISELGPIGHAHGALPFVLSQNAATRSNVDQILAAAKIAGATIVTEPISREWGGYSGYFADPDGFRWEIAYNPSPIGESVL